MIKTHGSSFFIKHFNCFDSLELDDIYNEYLQSAIQKGLPTNKDRLDQLNKTEQWTEKDNNKIKDLQLFITNAEIGKSKAILKRDQDYFLEELKKAKNELKDLENQKISLIGNSAEIFASKKSYDVLISRSLYKDSELKTPIIQENDDIADSELENYYSIYNNHTTEINEKIIKKISISPYFINIFAICDNDVFKFYGKPAIELTLYQIDLFRNGKKHLHILSEMGGNIPKNIEDNPDELVSLYESRKNSQDILDKSQDQQATSIVGATKEDMERMGISNQTGPDLGKLAQSKGGRLNMMEIMQALGQ